MVNKVCQFCEKKKYKKECGLLPRLGDPTHLYMSPETLSDLKFQWGAYPFLGNGGGVGDKGGKKENWEGGRFLGVSAI